MLYLKHYYECYIHFLPSLFCWMPLNSADCTITSSSCNGLCPDITPPPQLQRRFKSFKPMRKQSCDTPLQTLDTQIVEIYSFYFGLFPEVNSEIDLGMKSETMSCWWTMLEWSSLPFGPPELQHLQAHVPWPAEPERDGCAGGVPHVGRPPQLSAASGEGNKAAVFSGGATSW